MRAPVEKDEAGEVHRMVSALELSVGGAPEGHDPTAGDIGYWAPDGDLVFYYNSDAPFFNGTVRIGALDGKIDAITRQREDFSVTIERAQE